MNDGHNDTRLGELWGEDVSPEDGAVGHSALVGLEEQPVDNCGSGRESKRRCQCKCVFVGPKWLGGSEGW